MTFAQTEPACAGPDVRAVAAVRWALENSTRAKASIARRPFQVVSPQELLEGSMSEHAEDCRVNRSAGGEV